MAYNIGERTEVRLVPPDAEFMWWLPDNTFATAIKQEETR